MALIPPDVGLRMRLQAETSLLQPTGAVHEIGADLPDFKPGMAFTARIVEAMPENVYRALVAGKAVTLSLPQGAKSGDVLELVVVDHTPKLLLARLAQPESQAAAPEPAYPHATLSQAGQMIGKLLPTPGQPPQAAPLNRGEPLISPAMIGESADIGARLAPRLADAVNKSGLFYEAHQARWIAGELPPAALLDEPQGRTSPLLRGAVADAPPAPATVSATPARLGEAPREAANAGENAWRSRETAAPSPLPPSVPEDLRPLVQQQLDAAATQRLLWHGEVWPGQMSEWEIRRDAPQREAPEAGTDGGWSTRLALTSPNLGRVEAGLQLAAGSLSVRIGTASAETAARMQAASAQLARSMEAAGLPVPAIQIRHVSTTDAG